MIRLDVTNDGTGNEHIANYECRLWLPGVVHTVRVEGFDRQCGWASLLRDAVDKLEQKSQVGVLYQDERS